MQKSVRCSPGTTRVLTFELVLVEAERRQGKPLRVILQVRDEDVMISESAVNLMPFAFEAHGLGGQES